MGSYTKEAGGGGGGGAVTKMLTEKDLTGPDDWGVDHDFLTAPAGVNGWAATFTATAINLWQYLRFSSGKLQGHFKGNGVDSGQTQIYKTHNLILPPALWPSFTQVMRQSVTAIGGGGNMELYWYFYHGIAYSEYCRLRESLDGGGYDRFRLDWNLDRNTSIDWSSFGLTWNKANVLHKFAYSPATGIQYGTNADNTALAPLAAAGYRGNGLDNGHGLGDTTGLTFYNGLYVNQSLAATTREFQFEIDLCKIVAPFAP